MKMLYWSDSLKSFYTTQRIPPLQLHWFTPSWWRYLMTGCRGFRNLWCRARGHPYPVAWYTLSRDEPDMRCRNCGEDLG